MACKNLFIKFSNVLTDAVGYYDLVDNEGCYVFRDKHTTELSTGITFSVSYTTNIYRLTNFRQSATYSACNPTPYTISWNYYMGASSGTFSILLNGNYAVSTNVESSGVLYVKSSDVISVNISSYADNLYVAQTCLTIDNNGSTLYDNCVQYIPSVSDSYGPYYVNGDGFINAGSGMYSP